MKKVLTLLTIVGAVPVFAHPGHDLFERGVAHAVTSPFHLAILTGTGVAFAVAATFVRKTRARRLLRIGSASCLLLALMLALFH